MRKAKNLMNTTKQVTKSTPSLRAEYKGYSLYATYVSVYRYKDNMCIGGSDRTEWHADNGTNVIEARTMKELKSRIDLI